MTEDVVPLYPHLVPAKSKEWGCRGCRLFQYSPTFTKDDRAIYQATLDPNRRETKNSCYKMEPVGPPDADVLVVFDGPTRGEDNSGVTGASGANRIFTRNAKVVGLDPAEFRTTYAYRCHDPKGSMTTKASVYCSGFLSAEIRNCKPKTIIALGPISLQLVTGKADANIEHYAGVPQRVTVAGHECDLFTMWSPGYVAAHDYLSKKYLQQFESLAKFLRGESAVAVDSSKYEIVATVERALEVVDLMLEAVEAGKVIDADTETSNLNAYKKDTRLSVVSLARSTKKGYAIMYNHDEVSWSDAERGVVRKALRRLFRHPAIKLRWHNSKFDMKWIAQHLGFWPRDPVEDTILTHYAVDENQQHGLKPLALMFTDMGDYDAELDKALARQTYPDRPRYDLVPMNLLGVYAAQDPVATRKLAGALHPMVEEQGTEVAALAYNAMPAFSAALTRMEAAGIAIDEPIATKVLRPLLVAMSEKSWASIINDPVVRRFSRDMENAARAKMKKPKPIEEKRYFEFSLGSPKQLQKLLYDPAYFGHEVTSHSDSGAPSTDKEALNDMAAAGSPIAKAIMEHRLDVRLIDTYLDPICSAIAAQGDNLIHGEFVLIGTKTGRLSSKNPNLQNQSNKLNALNKRIFVSRYGDDGVFVQYDYSQIELRILAAVSNDPRMIGAYTDGKDLHMLTACAVFNLTEEQFKALPKDVQKKYRTVAKRVNFGIAYGIGAPGIQSTLKSDGVVVSEDEARTYLDTFYEKYPDVGRWIERVENSTERDEFSRSLWGRRRRLEEIGSAVSDMQARAKRQAVNHVIQSTAGDCTMTALTLMDQEICLRRGDDPRMVLPTVKPRDFPVDARWKRAHIVVQVHDMIGIDAHKDVAADVVDMMERVMPNVVDLAPLVWGDAVAKRLKVLKRVKLEVDGEVGPNWRDAAKVKSGKDVAKAMHVANGKKAFLDKDPLGKWDETMEKALAEEFAAKYAHA